MTVSLTHPLPGHKQTGWFGNRAEFWENGKYIPAMFHNGADFGAPAGTPIRAAHAGKVALIDWDGPGGWSVMITASFGRTYYAHMREESTDVRVGQNVVAGQVIGRVGMSGTAVTGPHLHLMLDLGDGWVDPVPFIKKSDPPKPPKPPQPAPEPEPTLGDLMAFKSIGIGYRPEEKKDRIITTGLDFEDGQVLPEWPVTKSYGDSFYKATTEGGLLIISQAHYDGIVEAFPSMVAEKREHELAVARASSGA